MTLGDIVGPAGLHADEHRQRRRRHQHDITSVTGPGANDYFAIPDPDNCPSPDLQGDITLAPAGTCTVDIFFYPARSAHAHCHGQRLATRLNSGVTLALNGVGTIGYYQVSSNGTVGPLRRCRLLR